MLPPPRELPERAPRLADGRYVLMARIGRGGMAGVYAAWDVAIEEWRAIKVLLPKHARDAGLRMRFEREGETMRSLKHPNLVRVYGISQGEKLPFLVMELIDAGSLYRWTKTHGPMPPRMAVEAMIQLCAGVTAVHAAGVVHRDIKPRNVLIHFDGVLKLTDFGIAQLEQSQETRTGLAMGTLGFMSPEQLHDAKSVDLRTDIYAIGATLWSQLTGRKARDLFRLEGERDLMDGVPDPIQRLLSRALAYERDDRYPSAEAMSEALAAVLEELPEDPPDAPPLPLNLSLSFKSKPENTFSEILTTMHPDEEGAPELSVPPPLWAETPGPLTPPPAPRASLPPLPPGPRSNQVRSLPPPAPRSVPPRSTPTPRPRATHEEHSQDSLPSYLLGVEQPAEVRRPEVITYRPEEDAPPAPPPAIPRWVRRLVAVLVLMPVASVAGVVLMVVLVAGLGTWQVRSATSGLIREQDELADRIEAEAALRTDLLALGADTGPVEQAFARWTRTADEPDRTEAALEYLLMAEQQAQERIGLSARSHEGAVVQQRLARLKEARDELLAAEDAWNAAIDSAPGRLAIALHLAPAGDPR